MKGKRASGFSSAPWWRHGQYEIAGGFIRPVDGSPIVRYDIFEEADRASAYGAPIYQELLNLDATFEKRIDDVTYELTVMLTAESEAAIVNWCNHHGLLGLLHHKAVIIVDPFAGEDQLSDAGTLHRQRIWTKQAGVWEHRTSTATDVVPFAAGALMRDERDGIEWFTFEQLEGAYYPTRMPWRLEVDAQRHVEVSNRLTHWTPPTLNPIFSPAYAEPVAEFVSMVHQIQRAVTGASNFRKLARLRAPSRVPSLFTPQRMLNELVRDVGVGFSSGGEESTWKAPHLLAAYGLLIQRDLSRSVPRKCPGCGQVFVSAAYQARFCSAKCQQRVAKQRQRRAARKKSRSRK